ncbi:hypothetical protein [Nitrospira moscoviensis]|uniref:Uncharacterized protein n=1 Tax=Nitrospira moscoviensis TaxID=42253 RepID=A0A0K2G7G2_NITMO|nr:hypothetical protein [Nitrospira moscoviensis]ALA56875.1 conserved protein of unknown function, TPR repeat domain [Nitrospira moscoviensis]
MTCTRISGSALLLASLLVVPGLEATADQTAVPPSERAELGKLGVVHFPTSTRSDEAQAHFLRGVAALHSFWYPVALEEFRAATKRDPEFMMGYWGEAMAHNHPLWGDPQETDAARQVIRTIRMTPELTARERAYLHAVTVLYGEGDKAARDKAYAGAMERIYREYPDDAEAALFYALALMGRAGKGPGGLEARLRAGAIASQVFERKPDHPGAAHYVIHAYDDPQHAHLALDAARRYAEIAPAAPHALHMPSHIFLQLGMWPETAAANEASWAASDAWVAQRQLPISERDYHSLQWLHYAYLQQGRSEEAGKLLETMRASLSTFPKEDQRNLAYGGYILSSMAAAQLVETQRWEQADRILGSAPPIDAGATRDAGGPYQAPAVLTQTPSVFARGLAAAMRGSSQAQESMGVLQTISRDQTDVPLPFVKELRRAAGIQALEIAAAGDAEQGTFEAAIRRMEHAIALVDAMPAPSGPPALIKPAYELFGEILLRAGRAKEAAAQFEKSLARHPDRARSLLGGAQAAAQSGEPRRAAALYTTFLRQWRQADPQLVEIREAQAYLQQAQAQ